MKRRTLLKTVAATGLLAAVGACAQTEGNDIVDIALLIYPYLG